MDRHSLRQVLLSRGIRIADDDPLFLLLEVNEVHFDAIASRHIQSLDQRLIENVVSRVLTRPAPSPTRVMRSEDAEVTQVLRNLDQATLKFLNLEKAMAEVAKAAAAATSKPVIDSSLQELSKDINSTLVRLEKNKVDGSTLFFCGEKVMLAASSVQRAADNLTAWWWVSLVAVLLALGGGAWAGHKLTTVTVEKVQAACTAKQMQ